MSSLPPSADVVVVGGGGHRDEHRVPPRRGGRGRLPPRAGPARGRFDEPRSRAACVRSSPIRSTSRSGCAASRRSTRFAERPGPRSTSIRSATCSCSTDAEDVAVFEASVALQNELGVPEPVRRARRGGGALPARGSRRRARRHVLPARRPREPGGCHAGVRRRRARARRARCHRLCGDRDRPSTAPRSAGCRRRPIGDDRDGNGRLRRRRMVARARTAPSGSTLPVVPVPARGRLHRPGRRPAETASR